jgi:hypothetical protein
MTFLAGIADRLTGEGTGRDQTLFGTRDGHTRWYRHGCSPCSKIEDSAGLVTVQVQTCHQVLCQKKETRYISTP